ncbi:unnamed protein product [Ixodes persulcatus]
MSCLSKMSSTSLLTSSLTHTTCTVTSSFVTLSSCWSTVRSESMFLTSS